MGERSRVFNLIWQYDGLSLRVGFVVDTNLERNLSVTSNCGGTQPNKTVVGGRYAFALTSLAGVCLPLENVEGWM